MTLHQLHNTLFWVLLACFLTTTSSVLFFTFGYRFSFERGIFVYTGSVTIKSNPRDVDILVDGEPFPQSRISTVNRTLHLTGLRPGNHLLRVEAPGFRAWEKKITVRSGVSTEFWNIVLPRESYERTDLIEGGLLEAFFSPRERRFAIATEEEGKTKILVLDRSSLETSQVFESDEFLFDQGSTENIEWAPDGDKLLIPFRDSSGRQTIVVVDLRTLQATDWGAEGELQELHDARWDPTDNRAFFALSEGRLLRIVPGARNPDERIRTLREHVGAYDLSGRTIYFLESGSDAVFRAALGGRELDPETLPIAIPNAGGFVNPKISVYDEKRVAIYNDAGSGYLINDDGGLEPEFLSLGSGIRGVQFSDDGKKLLFHTTNEISVAFTRDWDMQPYRASGDIVQIARFSHPVFQPKWSRDYEHVLFSIGGEIRMAELDRRDRRNIVTVDSQDDRDIIQLLPDFGEGRIYTLSETGDGDAILSFIEFPEPLGLFGQ
jgi:hypothetical protein